MRPPAKKTAWVQLPSQLRIDPELGDEIRAIAAANYRTIQGQIMLWIADAVKQEKVRKGNDLSTPVVIREKGRHAANS
jgi:hypothetical protein